jgi:Tol biopolymer transport system component
MSNSSPTWFPSGDRIAYVKLDQSNFFEHDIWVMDADGSNQTNLTERLNEWYITGISVSPTGKRIAFTAFGELFLMKAAPVGPDNQPILLTNSSARWSGYPDWSPDGTRIAFVRNGDGGKWPPPTSS